MDDNLSPPFILREAGLFGNEQTKLHCKPGTDTGEDRTIQDQNTRLFITMQLRSILSSFPSRKPSEDNIEDGVVVVITPKVPTWDT